MNDYWNTKLKDMNTEGPTMSAGSADDSRVSAENNKIYFYSGVTRQDNLVLNKLLHSTGNKLKKQYTKCFTVTRATKSVLAH